MRILRVNVTQSGLLATVHHPRNAVLIDEHAKPFCPESLLNRHLHFPALSKSVKDAIGIFSLIHIERDRKPLGLPIVLRGCILP